jgi:hypothetical protein
MRTLTTVVLSAVLIVAVAVAAYLLGHVGAPGRQEFESEYVDGFKVGFTQGAERARARSVRGGATKGRAAGRLRGKTRGAESGAEEGREAAEAELARIEEERLAAEAAAAEAAELAIPAPCRGLPDSTARRMCIGAVEAGTYP